MTASARSAAINRLPSEGAREDLMVQVAKLYFQLDRTQSDIATELALTRWQVGRLLQEARESGVVRIEIAPRRGRLAAQEAALQKRWGLSDAVVVPEDSVEAVAQAAAQWLVGRPAKPTLIGVSWGRTLAAVARGLPQGWNPGAHVVLVNGATALRLTSPGISNVAEAFAATAGGTATLLPAPAILGRSETRAALEGDPVIASALDLARQAEMVVFGMGAMGDSVLETSGFLSAPEMAALRRAGAVGDILGRFVDRSGAIVSPEIDARTLGLRPEALRLCLNSVAVVSGAAKHQVALAALRARLASVMITDEATADYLLTAPLQAS